MGALVCCSHSKPHHGELLLCFCVSGTERHELTSWRSFHSIFKFFEDALETRESSDQQASNTVTTRSANRIKHDEM